MNGSYTLGTLGTLGTLALMGAFNACSANSDAGTPGGSPGGTAGTEGGAATSGTSGASGASGSAGEGAGGSMISTDSGLKDGPLGDGACEGFNKSAEIARQPADIIWAIDTSGSMFEETAYVQQNINKFNTQISASGIDVHVVMLADPPIFPGFPGICVPPPLGSGFCPLDSKAPSYLHVANSSVASTDGLEIIHTTFPMWKNMLRPEATHTLVIVTDDDATSFGWDDAQKWITDFTALDPILQAAGPDGSIVPSWKMSGIYCFTACPTSANIGTRWKEIIDTTGGIHGDLCTQMFDPVLNDLATAIVTGSTAIECEWDIPDPPPGETLNPEEVNVRFGAAGSGKTIYKVDGASQCDPTEGGWYYDDDTNPTRIITCDATCADFTTVEGGVLDVEFGCATQMTPK